MEGHTAAAQAREERGLSWFVCWFVGLPQYARAGLATIGYDQRVTPFWAHAIMWGAIAALPPWCAAGRGGRVSDESRTSRGRHLFGS